jgi:glycosyltransferase involved in cell wall biosynthesis
MSAQPEKLTILQLVPEPLPTHRPDLADLFGTFLPRQGIDCHIVGHAGRPDDKQANAGYRREARACAGMPWAPRPLREAGYLLLVLKELFNARRHGADLIQVRDMATLGLLAWMVARLSGLKFAWWMSFPMSEDRIARAAQLHARGRWFRALLLQAKGRGERWLLYRFLLPRADHVFVQSRAMLEMVSAQGVPAALMTPVPMCVDCDQLFPGAFTGKRPPGWEDCPLFVYHGTLDAARDPASMVRALAILRERHPEARLLLVGDASTEADRLALQQVIEAEGQQHAVQVTGWLARAQAAQYLVGADVCLSWCPRSPVLDVGTPTKLIECLALGLPVIANDHPDQLEILHASQAGRLCATDAQSLAEAMQEALVSPAAARERARRGPGWVREERNYARLAGRLAQRYRMLVGTGRLVATQTRSNG